MSEMLDATEFLLISHPGLYMLKALTSNSQRIAFLYPHVEEGSNKEELLMMQQINSASTKFRLVRVMVKGSYAVRAYKALLRLFDYKLLDIIITTQGFWFLLKWEKRVSFTPAMQNLQLGLLKDYPWIEFEIIPNIPVRQKLNQSLQKISDMRESSKKIKELAEASI